MRRDGSEGARLSVSIAIDNQARGEIVAKAKVIRRIDIVRLH